MEPVPLIIMRCTFRFEACRVVAKPRSLRAGLPPPLAGLESSALWCESIFEENVFSKRAHRLQCGERAFVRRQPYTPPGTGDCASRDCSGFVSVGYVSANSIRHGTSTSVADVGRRLAHP